MNKAHFLSVGLPLISAIFSVAFFCLWLLQKKRRYILNWSLAFACGLVGSGVGLARMFLTEAALFSFVGNGFLVGMAYFACRGAMIRHTARPFDSLLLPIYITTLTAGLWFGFVNPSIFARGSAISLGAAAMLAIAAWKMLKSDDMDAVGYLTVAAFAMTAISLVARPILVYFLDGAVSTEAEVTGSWWGVSFRILGTVSVVSVSVLFLQRIATDLVSKLNVQVHTDHLTGVLNRGGFFARSEAAKLHGLFAIILCDIDEFKAVNDTYGHKVGDTVIQDLAKILTEAGCLPGRTVGRLGGEEFVMLLLGADLVEARTVAEKIRTQFAATLHQGVAPSHTVTVSAGVAVAYGKESVDLVIDHADAALYQAKQKGRNCVEIAVRSTIEPQQRITQTRRRRGQSV